MNLYHSLVVVIVKKMRGCCWLILRDTGMASTMEFEGNRRNGIGLSDVAETVHISPTGRKSILIEDILLTTWRHVVVAVAIRKRQTLLGRR
jgi:hypothetical protein